MEVEEWIVVVDLRAAISWLPISTPRFAIEMGYA